MMKLLLTRVLPALATVGIFTTALSPVQPALALFGAAADALAGETSVAVDTSDLDQLAKQAGQLAVLPGSGLPKPATRARQQKRAVLEKLADAHETPAKPDDEAFGWKPGDRAPRPIGAPRTP